MPSVLQPWVQELSLMQQAVLLTAIRAPDGVMKYHASKFLIRWYRRCILITAFEKKAILNPYTKGGGSFTGPSYELPEGDIPEPWEPAMDNVVSAYLKITDELPSHFQDHLRLAAEIVGYKHPDARIRAWWNKLYVRLVECLHLFPESESQMDSRLGDTMLGWLARSDPATEQ